MFQFRRRSFQFTIRALLALMLIVSLCGSYVAWRRAMYADQFAAVREIERLGGQVESVPEDDGLDRFFVPAESCVTVAGVVLRGRPITPELMGCVGRVFTLQLLGISDSKLDDEALAPIAHLREVRSFSLDNTYITDRGFRHIAGFTKMEDLSLCNVTLTDEALRTLHNMQQLRHLEVLGAEFTDAGLVRLQSLKLLHTLYLAETKVSDAGIDDLLAIPSIEDVRVASLSRKGRLELNKRLFKKLGRNPDDY